MNKNTLSTNNIILGMYEKALSKNLSWPERLDFTRKANYDYIEMSIDESDERIGRLDWSSGKLAKLNAACKNSAVPIKSLSLSAHRRFPLGSEDKTTRHTSLDLFKKTIEFSVHLGIRHILVSGADIYYEESTEQTEALFIDGLEQGIRWAEEAGIMLALENWDIRIDSLTKVMKYVNHFNSPWFKVYADIGNLAFAGYDVLSELEVARDHIVAVHLKDTLKGKLRYVYPGEGIVPFVDSLKKLAEMGYQGSYLLELWTGDLPNSFEIVSAANKWIRSQMNIAWSK
ncbi:MAG: L-ribulose-5-phosphate 3-epimerase, partial [Bacteroidetes bacterium]|nr:L-ribulose-5-phosphate 3-epimerase [Bacteroidota bacterium]